MTRLASILGVATVATLVLLSGCESATQKKDTDYAAALAGIWTYSTEEAVVSLGNMPLPAVRTVTVTITAGDDANTGSFSLMVVDAVKPSANVMGLELPLSNTVDGTIAVDAAKITVTIKEDGIMLDPRISSAGAAEATALKSLLTAAPQELAYKIKDNELKVSGAALLSLKVTTAESPQLTLTKSTTS